MDSKYEFNLKMDQLKKLIAQDDMATAFKIVDSIDWNRVRNVNLLTMAATVYEKNNELDKAKSVLSSALDRAPVGKRMLYKLSELNVLTGDLDDAEDYYYEFRRADPTDPGNYLLQYMILSARHAPYDKQAQTLELYCETDPDEKWLYELAATYDRAGEGDKCVATCDKIALLYGSTDYSARALRLKMKYASLSPEQQDMLYPRSYMDLAMVNEAPAAADEGESELFRVYGLADEPDISTVQALQGPPAEEYDSGRTDFEEAKRSSDALAAERYEDEDSAFDEYLRQLDLSARYEHRQEVARRLSEAPAAEPAPAQPAEAESDTPAQDSAQLSFVFDGALPQGIEAESEPAEVPAEPEPVEAPAAPVPAAAAPAAPVPAAPAPAAPAPAPAASGKFHMIVEAPDLRKAFDIAIDELKAIHRENGISNTAAKTDAARLNTTGFTDAISAKVRGKDLIVESAGKLESEVAAALLSFIKTDESGAVVVLLDTPEGLDALEAKAPGLFEVCDYVSDEESLEAYEDDYDEDTDEEEESAQSVVTPASHGEQMEIDDFAQFCAQYAASIDCSITGKSMLALYERIELMEEDGIPLTRESAVDLIEEAADKAEKPPIGKRIAGAFHSKYDKNGLLILKEDDFI